MRLWDVNDGSELARVEAHSGPVYSVDFLADGKQLASGSQDATIRLSNLEVLLAPGESLLGIAQEATGIKLKDTVQN